MSNKIEVKKRARRKIDFIFGFAIILITGIVNVFGYFHLPDEVATQLTFGGLSKSRVPTPIYLFMSSIFVVIVSILYFQAEEKEQKIKWMLINMLICILNIVMIVIQIY